MQVALLYIDDRRYPIADGVSADQIQSQIVAAINAGGSFVHVLDSDDAHVEVLVTQSSKIRIERREIADSPQPSEPDLQWPSYDFLSD